MSKEQNKSINPMKEARAVCEAMIDWTGAKYSIMPLKTAIQALAREYGSSRRDTWRSLNLQRTQMLCGRMTPK
jgi:hypothetical protein